MMDNNKAIFTLPRPLVPDSIFSKRDFLNSGTKTLNHLRYVQFFVDYYGQSVETLEHKPKYLHEIVERILHLQVASSLDIFLEEKEENNLRPLLAHTATVFSN